MIKQHYYLALAFCLCILVSCKDEVPKIGHALPDDISLVNMIVTNDKGEDVVLNSSGYAKTSEGIETFGFDTWEVYMNGKLIQTAKENIEYRRKKIDHYKENPEGKKVINLESDLAIDEILDKDYKKAHTWEYAVSSKSLFGDSEIHRIRMEYQPRFESLLDPQVEYDIYVDGKKQTVYYPQWWDLQPHADFGKFVNPCFILNIDQ